MKAIILAAGRGSRMAALTQSEPKCMARLAGRRLIEWQLASLKAAGVRDIVVVRGYQGGLLAGPGYTTIDNPNWSETNMVATLRCAGSILEREPCLVLYADIVYHPDHVRRLAAAAGDIVVAYDTRWLELWRLRFADPLSDAETFRQSNGRLEAIGQKPASVEDIQGQYMGMIKLSPQGWEQIEGFLATCEAATVAKLDMTALLGRLLSNSGKIDCLPVAGQWCEVDSADDIERYETEIAHADAGTPWSHDWRWGST